MWREMVAGFGGQVDFHDPADGQILDQIEQRLGQSLPDPLKQLLLETDGLDDEFGTEVVWSAQRILDDNEQFRTESSFRDLYMPFDDVMFFGDNGGGDQFAFVRNPQRNDVFVWDHETDARNWVSASLEDYLQRSIQAEGEDWYR
ncbi:SMI1-KNR4 cell-wall [Streptomyces sp. 2323.1]|uniref:SMI1/KNR4 family protein n=1 Tax=Streptomyces sp. 2323.1 TaxID=1938841 RepID=UPI000BB92A3B|nr:SMI1/KNR4 family protein [Streptomyces sp. 2323.1]SOE13193.1 SMI1-KNR4 cell-wall [Streptomyces sp. 2323.1]